jgi:hypothetical protein
MRRNLLGEKMKVNVYLLADLAAIYQALLPFVSQNELRGKC